METVRESSPVQSDLTQSHRLQSLDAYRGLIMLTLLTGGIFSSLKGHPIWNWLYVLNNHVEWEGCVYTDLIQPSFMFMVGAAMPFAFARRAAMGQSWGRQFRHAAIRAFNLVLIGVLLDHFGAEKIQIGFIRVLQQIAFGYLCAFFFLGRSLRTQGIVATSTLLGYQLLWMYNDWNGPGGPWAQCNLNIGSAFDLWLLGRNYSGFYVGMNAIPSTVTILFGVMAGRVIQTMDRRRACGVLFLAGIGGVVVGLAISPWFPLIKRIWTPSFTIFSGGCTTLMLLLFFWVIDSVGWKCWSFPLVVVGTNSIAAYVIGNSFKGWFFSLSDAWVNWLQGPLGDVGFPIFRMALFGVAAWAVLYWLYRRKIFFKV